MGVGNFFGRMPENMRSDSKLYGIELDGISGRIAQKLYPDADIAIQGFEKNHFQNGCFDVAVGNVPFGELHFKDNKQWYDQSCMTISLRRHWIKSRTAVLWHL